MQENYNFEHYISLGYFCSVALELKKCGLRSKSSPFDWNITWSFKGVIKEINNHFEDVLNEQMLFQEKGCSEHYRSQRYLMDYYHDFDGYHSLEEQIEDVKKIQ